jgi:2Fe-2S ferredoxin
MLDLAFEPRENSRLACQIVLSPAIDGLEVEVPAGVSNRLGDF